MKFDTTMIDLTNVSIVLQDDNKLFLEIVPITYKDSRNPRLPRKSSKQTNLQVDTNHIIKHAFNNISTAISNKDRFSVEIKVFKANDRLGGGDLDNYCKAILDAITSTSKVWVVDEQVDEIKIKRLNAINKSHSFIQLTISKL